MNILYQENLFSTKPAYNAIYLLAEVDHKLNWHVLVYFWSHMITACKFSIRICSTLVSLCLIFIFFYFRIHNAVLCHRSFQFVIVKYFYFRQIISLVIIIVVLRNTSSLDSIDRHNKNGIYTFRFMFLRRRGIRLLKSMGNY